MILVYSNIFLYALCYQFQRPIEPFLVEKLNQEESDSGLAYGRLQSFFSMVQTVGSPIVGILLDRLGARQGFIIVFCGSALSYGLLSIATSMSLLYLSKIPARACVPGCADSAVS